MRNFRLLIALAVLITTPALMVLGQSTPNFTQGQIPSLSQWNGYFGAKADLLYLAENVMADGAKADGTSDDSGAINTALGKTLNGQSKNVYMPAGTYHVKHAINLGANQCLIGDGWNTIIDVGSDFSSTDPGVIVVATNGGGGNQACVKNLLFNVNQVTDLTKTTTASSGEGATTITVNSNSGIVVGDYVADQSNKNAILSGQNSIGAQPTVTNISGNTITISQPVQTGSGGVGNGDSIHFAPTRSMYKTLAQGCTTTAGGTGCKFPWLIYNNGANTFYVDHVFAQGAWDGVYQRGSAFYFGTMFIGAADVGLDIDNCHNSPTIVNYQHWFWGYQNTVNNTTAVSDVVYDGQMVAANIGAVDGASFHSLQSFEGIYNFTANFSYGHISSLIADGNNAEINVSATGSGHLELGEVYTSGSRFDGAPKWNVNNSNNQYIEIGVWRSAQNLSATPSLLVAGGVVSIGSGSFYSSASGTGPVISVTGGKLNLSPAVHFGGSTISPIISQSGTGAISAVGVHFGGSTPGVGVQIGVDTDENLIKDVDWNGWTLSGPSGTFTSGPMGSYEASEQQSTRTVSSGTTDTVNVFDKMITWNSSNAITETVNGCSSNNAGQELFFNDKSGHGGTIDPVGATTVNGTSVYSAAANSRFVIKCDGVSNWAVGTGTATGNGLPTTGGAMTGTLTFSDGTNSGGAVYSFPTHAAFIAFNPTTFGSSMPTALVAGYNSVGDGGGATFDWNPTSTATADGIFTVQATGVSTGRWIMRVPGMGVHPEVAGAHCDYNMTTGTGTDDTAALNALSSALSNGKQNSGNIIQNPGKTCLINSGNVTIQNNVAIIGVGEPLTQTQSGNTHAFKAFLAINPSFSLVCGTASAIKNMVIWRAGLAEKPANMEAVIAATDQWAADSSVGISAPNADCTVENVVPIGFHTGVQMGGARAVVHWVLGDDYTVLEESGSSDANESYAVRGKNIWAFNLDSHVGLSTNSGVVVSGGTGYTNGDVLTVPVPTGVTCTTPATVTATVSGGVVTALTSLDSGDCLDSQQPWGVTAFTINAGGAGYGANTTFTATLSTGTPGVAATLNVTTNPSGAVTTINSWTTGAYTGGNFPSPVSATTGGAGTGFKVNVVTMARNVLALTGGTGIGATATFSAQTSGYRSGPCIYLHDKVGGTLIRGQCESHQTGILLSSIWQDKMFYIGAEGGFINLYDHHTIGVDTENCVSAVSIFGIQVDTEWTGGKFNHLASSDGGSCSLANNQSASVTINGGHIGASNQWQGAPVVYFGPHSTTYFAGVQGFGPGIPATIQVDANVKQLVFGSLLLASGLGNTTPLISVDPTSIDNISLPDNLTLYGTPLNMQAPPSLAGGTGASVSSFATNKSGTGTFGTGTVTSGTLTFGNGGFSAYNTCTVTPQTALTNFSYSVSLSAITLNATSLTSASFAWRCDGF